MLCGASAWHLTDAHTTGYAGRRDAPSGQAGTYPLVCVCACIMLVCECPRVTPWPMAYGLWCAVR
eukprot:4506511-Prymnesium_polylepis.1